MRTRSTTMIPRRRLQNGQPRRRAVYLRWRRASRVGSVVIAHRTYDEARRRQTQGSQKAIVRGLRSGRARRRSSRHSGAARRPPARGRPSAARHRLQAAPPPPPSRSRSSKQTGGEPISVRQPMPMRMTTMWRRKPRPGRRRDRRATAERAATHLTVAPRSRGVNSSNNRRRRAALGRMRTTAQGA